MPSKNSKRSFRGRRNRRPKMSFETRVLQVVREKKEVKIKKNNFTSQPCFRIWCTFCGSFA